MSDQDTPGRSPSRLVARVVRVLSLLLGATLVLYALSDHPLYGDRPGFGGAQLVLLIVGVGFALLVFTPTTWNLRALVLAFSGILALSIGEIAGERLLAPKFRKAFVSDPELIFKLAPGRKSETLLAPINGGTRVMQRINAHGFRGHELRPSGSAFRVVVYGDSFIHAAYSPLEETFSYQLGKLLEEQLGFPVEVINAGVSSYGPDQVLKKLEAEIGELKPDLVIVAIFAGNDYGDLLRNKLFRLDDEGGMKANPWTLSEELAIAFELSERESVLRRALRSRFGGPRPGPLFGDAPDRLGAMLEFWLAEAELEYEDFVVGGSDVVTNATMDHFSADVSLQPESSSAQYKIRLMEAVLSRIKGAVDVAGVPMTFLFIPHPLDACGEFLGGRVDREVFPGYEPENLTAPLEAISTRLGSPYLNLLGIFEGADAERLYLRGGDDHWNAAGQRLAAQHMVTHLVESGLLARKGGDEGF